MVLIAVTTVAVIHNGAAPMERALGLAHGRLLSTPQRDFLVFDNLTTEGAQTLNRDLFSLAADPTELVAANGYGLWRMAILLALVYGLMLTTVRALGQLRLRNAVAVFQRKTLLLLSTLVGLGSALCHQRQVGPTLFAVSFFGLMVAAMKSRPNAHTVATRLELLDMFRALWAGWLLAGVFTFEADWSRLGEFQGLGLFLGVFASFFATSGVNLEKRQKNPHWTRLRPSCRHSFEMGCWESLGVMVTLTLCAALGGHHLFVALQALGAFGWGRAAHSLLLRHILTIDPVVEPGHRRESLARIASGVWFLSPLLLGSLIQRWDQTALMVWLFGLSVLVKGGRPWGSVSRVVGSEQFPPPVPKIDRPTRVIHPPVEVTAEHLREAQRLTPMERTAVLVTSLSPEVVAKLFAELSSEEVTKATIAVTELPIIHPIVRALCVEEFLYPGSSKRRAKRYAKTHEDWQKTVLQPLERWVYESPEAAVRRLQTEGWLGPKQFQRRSFDLELEPVTLNLSEALKVDIVYSCLPRKLLERLLGEMPDIEARQMRERLLALPYVLPEIRALVVRECLFLCEDGVPPTDGDVLKRLEEFAQTNVGRFYKIIRSRYGDGARKRHVCLECRTAFSNGISLRKHQLSTEHKGSRICERRIHSES